MDKVRDDFDMITYETDSILYYNPEDLYDSETKEKIRQAKEEAREEGLKEGRTEGLKEGREKGKQEGKLEGIKEGIKETAKKMKQEKISIETISKITGLSLEEIENI